MQAFKLHVCERRDESIEILLLRSVYPSGIPWKERNYEISCCLVALINSVVNWDILLIAKLTIPIARVYFYFSV